MLNHISQFVKERRKKTGLTQVELSERSGVGLRFLRELEQGKTTVQLNKANQVFNFVGYQLGVEQIDRGSGD